MISKKEILAIYQIIITAIAIVALVMLSLHSRYPFDMWIFFGQCTLFSTAVYCLIFGVGTWFYNSSFRPTRNHIRIVCFVILIVLNLLVPISAVLYASNYTGETIFGFEVDIWDDFVLNEYKMAAYLSYVVAVLMVPMNLFILFNIIIRVRDPPKPTTATPSPSSTSATHAKR